MLGSFKFVGVRDHREVVAEDHLTAEPTGQQQCSDTDRVKDDYYAEATARLYARQGVDFRWSSRV